MGQNKKIWLYAFASVMVTLSTLGFGRMSYGILMPFMKDSLALTYGQAGALGTAASIGYLGLVLFAGIMATKWGSKRLVVMGTLLVACGLFYLATVQSFAVSVVGMIVLGIGTALAYTPLVNIIVGWFPQKKGMLIGFLGSGAGLGMLISSLLIPHFTAWFSGSGWRYMWILFGSISVMSALVSYFILRDPPVPLLKSTQKKESFVREVYLNNKILLIAVIYGLIGFAYLIPANFMFSFILESQIDQYVAGIIFTVGGLMSILSGPLWGTVSDKIGRKRSLLIILSIGIVSMVIPIVFPVLLGFVASQFFWGITVVGMLSLTQALSTEQIHPSYAPVALGYVTVFFAAGQLLGPGLGGLLIDYFGGISYALLLCCGLLLLALLLAIRLPKEGAIEPLILQDNKKSVEG